VNIADLHYEHPDIKGYLDVQDGLARLAGNKKIYIRLLESFAGDTHYPQLLQHARMGDYDAVAKAAHMIKGVAANLSLPMIFQLAAIIDARLKTGDNDILADVEALGEATQKTLEHIESIKEGFL